MTICAIYARKSTDQTSVAEDAKSVTGHASSAILGRVYLRLHPPRPSCFERREGATWNQWVTPSNGQASDLSALTRRPGLGVLAVRFTWPSRRPRPTETPHEIPVAPLSSHTGHRSQDATPRTRRGPETAVPQVGSR